MLLWWNIFKTHMAIKVSQNLKKKCNLWMQNIFWRNMIRNEWRKSFNKMLISNLLINYNGTNLINYKDKKIIFALFSLFLAHHVLLWKFIQLYRHFPWLNWTFKKRKFWCHWHFLLSSYFRKLLGDVCDFKVLILHGKFSPIGKKW